MPKNWGFTGQNARRPVEPSATTLFVSESWSVHVDLDKNWPGAVPGGLGQWGWPGFSGDRQEGGERRGRGLGKKGGGHGGMLPRARSNRQPAFWKS